MIEKRRRPLNHGFPEPSLAPALAAAGLLAVLADVEKPCPGRGRGGGCQEGRRGAGMQLNNGQRVHPEYIRRGGKAGGKTASEGVTPLPSAALHNQPNHPRRDIRVHLTTHFRGGGSWGRTRTTNYWRQAATWTPASLEKKPRAERETPPPPPSACSNLNHEHRPQRVTQPLGHRSPHQAHSTASAASPTRCFHRHLRSLPVWGSVRQYHRHGIRPTSNISLTSDTRVHK